MSASRSALTQRQNLGGMIGGFISFAQNYHKDTGGTISSSTYWGELDRVSGAMPELTVYSLHCHHAGRSHPFTPLGAPLEGQEVRWVKSRTQPCFECVPGKLPPEVCQDCQAGDSVGFGYPTREEVSQQINLKQC